ncbi:MAG TPA: AraC family transcriptional regulator [Candidatus Methylomirabilis sp.]|nr:AraC family transcriptional regulator [Candidatus Methylomirabilis sp.]
MAAFARSCFQDRTGQPAPSELIGSTENLRLSLISDAPGLVEFSGSPRVIVSLHVGPSVVSDCRRGGERHCGTMIHGDIEIIPPNLGGAWEIQSRDTALVFGLKLGLLHSVVEEAGGDPAKLRVRNRFRARDAQIEHIGWALKAEMEDGYPCGRLYTDSLATALAARVVQNYSSLSRPARSGRVSLPPQKLRFILAFIEDNLCRDIGLSEIAQAAGLSVSHFKSLFRKSVGVPPHQYLIRRRVERAAHQLRREKTPIGQIALENGFCHQSHLAMHTRRVLGVTPQELRESS